MGKHTDLVTEVIHGFCQNKLIAQFQGVNSTAGMFEQSILDTCYIVDDLLVIDRCPFSSTKFSHRVSYPCIIQILHYKLFVALQPIVEKD